MTEPTNPEAETPSPIARPLRINVITIFPDFVRAVFEHGVVRRGVAAGGLAARVPASASGIVAG